MCRRRQSQITENHDLKYDAYHAVCAREFIYDENRKSPDGLFVIWA